MLLGSTILVAFFQLLAQDIQGKDLPCLPEHTLLHDNVVALHSGNVGLAPFFPFYTKPLFSWRSRRVRALYKEAAQKHKVIYVDLYTKHADDPFYPDYGRFYAADSLHLNGAGYAIWYEKITSAIAKNGLFIEKIQP
jgi:hypothetical protein